MKRISLRLIYKDSYIAYETTNLNYDKTYVEIEELSDINTDTSALYYRLKGSAVVESTQIAFSLWLDMDEEAVVYLYVSLG